MQTKDNTETITVPLSFWCNTCHKWTRVEENHGDFYCARCGENYQCDECGYEIDRQGNCQRPEGHDDGE